MNGQPDREGDAGTEHHPTKQIPAKVIGSEQVLQAEARIGVSHVLLQRVRDEVDGHQQRCQQCVEDEETNEDQPAHRDRVSAKALPGILPEPDLLRIFPIDLLQRDGGGGHQPSLTRGSIAV